MNYKEEIFKKLNIKPDEKFKIKNHSFIYRLKENLILEFQLESGKWTDARNGLSYLLNGEYIIEKIINPTEEEQIAIKYAKLCGGKWLAIDKDGTVYAYKTKPIKDSNCCFWRLTDYKDIEEDLYIAFPLNFLSWEDEEPYYIGD